MTVGAYARHTDERANGGATVVVVVVVDRSRKGIVVAADVPKLAVIGRTRARALRIRNKLRNRYR